MFHMRSWEKKQNKILAKYLLYLPMNIINIVELLAIVEF